MFWIHTRSFQVSLGFCKTRKMHPSSRILVKLGLFLGATLTRYSQPERLQKITSAPFPAHRCLAKAGCLDALDPRNALL